MQQEENNHWHNSLAAAYTSRFYRKVSSQSMLSRFNAFISGTLAPQFWIGFTYVLLSLCDFVIVPITTLDRVLGFLF